MNNYFKETSCFSKKRYDSEKEAKKICKIVKRNRNTDTRYYGCHICGGYHLTKQGVNEKLDNSSSSNSY